MSELETFVIDYVQEVGGIAEPAGYGVYEILLPEPVAQRWQAPAYLQVTFADGRAEEVTRLGYNHPLVERMVQDAQRQTASTSLYVNGLRLQKSGVEEAALKGWAVINARVLPEKGATVARGRSTYVRFNFKAAILSHEKQERLASVLMDAHTGQRVEAAEQIETRATATEPDPLLASLRDAPVRWQPQGGPSLEAPLAQETLQALLERAKTAVLAEMAADLSELQKRVIRFHELDRARLTEYYDELERDLNRRLKTASPQRRDGLQDKLAAVQTERKHKLADLQERYQVRVNLTLLNLLVIQQPKLYVPVLIENRTTRIRVAAVWDPLLHRLEPLACGVCHKPVARAFLCHNGHLAHEDCLAPACVDCKRVFCRRCSDEIGACDVCQRPLCGHSRIECDTCDRGTCREHVGLCHAQDGQPVDLSAGKAAPPAAEPEPEPAPKASPPPKKRRPSRPQRPKQPARKQPTPKYPPMPKGVPKPQQIEVVLDATGITAFVLASYERQVALRVWNLSPGEGGIVRSCQCEKGEACPADGMILRPSDHQSVTMQMRQEIAALREEYGVSPQKVNYNRISSLDGMPFPVRGFELFGMWQDEEALAAARKRFAQLYWG